MGGSASNEERPGDSQYTDADLLDSLDEYARWFIVDKDGRTLASGISLRTAFGQIRMLRSAGRVPHLLVRGTGQPTVIQGDQLAQMYARVMSEC